MKGFTARGAYLRLSEFRGTATLRPRSTSILEMHSRCKRRESETSRGTLTRETDSTTTAAVPAATARVITCNLSLNKSATGQVSLDSHNATFGATWRAQRKRAFRLRDDEITSYTAWRCVAHYRDSDCYCHCNSSTIVLFIVISRILRRSFRPQRESTSLDRRTSRR